MHPNQQYAPQSNPKIPQYNQNYAPQQPTNIQRQYAPNGPTQNVSLGPNQYFHSNVQQRPVYQTRSPQTQVPYYQTTANMQMNTKPAPFVQNSNTSRQVPIIPVQTPIRPVVANPLAQQQSLVQLESKEMAELMDKSQPQGKKNFLILLGISFLIGVIITSKFSTQKIDEQDQVTPLIIILNNTVTFHNIFIFLTIGGNVCMFTQLGLTIIIEVFLFIAYLTLAILSYMEPCDGVKCCSFDLRDIKKVCPNGFFDPTIAFVVLSLASLVRVRYTYLWEKAKDEGVRCRKDLELIRGF